MRKLKKMILFDIVGLTTFTPGVPLTLVLHHSDGSKEEIKVNHSYNEHQIAWFKAGGALKHYPAEQA